MDDQKKHKTAEAAADPQRNTARVEKAKPDLTTLSREYREGGNQHPHHYLRLFSDRQLLDMMKPVLRNQEVIECSLLDEDQLEFLRRHIGRAPNPDGSVLMGKQDSFLCAIVSQVSGYIAEWPVPARLTPQEAK
jgi:hypothetical protein